MSAAPPFAGKTEAAPLSADGFARLMAALGPFEAHPHLAVAVSGGADSLALLLLADDWARRRGGGATGLTVDHGLRPESAAEARRIGTWLAGRAIPHVVLPWQGDKPASGLQAAARQARYDLLAGWCRRSGVLHLAVAHHLEDQAETVLLRLGHGSGLAGLAGMAAVVERPEVRVLRPLLGVSRESLRRTLRDRGQEWIEDPSNQNAAFARVRLRAAMPLLAAYGLSAPRLASTARSLGQARVAFEGSLATLLAEAVFLHPAGFALVDGAALTAAAPELARWALGRLLMVIGGTAYPPRGDRLARLHEALRGSAAGALAATLGGCRLLPWRGRLLIVREARRPGPAVAATPGGSMLWDGRYAVEFSARLDPRQGLCLGVLGCDGWRDAVEHAPEIKRRPLPAAVRPVLPALRDRHGVLGVPHLGYWRDEAAPALLASLRFAPRNSLAGPGFLPDRDGALLLPEDGVLSLN